MYTGLLINRTLDQIHAEDVSDTMRKEKKMKTFEGVCRYCGTTDILMAESQEEADRLTSEKCSCGGFAYEARHADWMDSVSTVCLGKSRYSMAELSSEEYGAITQSAEAIFQGVYEQVKIKLPNNETVDMTAGDKCKIIRTRKNTITGEPD